MGEEHLINKCTETANIDPLMPSVPYMAHLTNFFISILERIVKISSERREYESVDEKSTSLAVSRKTTENFVVSTKTMEKMN